MEKPTPWTKEEDALLVRQWPRTEAAMFPLRNANSIRLRGYRLGLFKHKCGRPTDWKKADDDLIRQNAGGPYNDVAKALGRTVGACRTRASTIGAIGPQYRGLAFMLSANRR